MENAKVAIIRLAGSIVLAAAILIGCGMLAKTFADHFYSSGGYPVPNEITARIGDVDPEYLSIDQAARYVGLWDSGGRWGAWLNLLDAGVLDGTYVVFEYQPDGPFLVFSKTKLDAWMEARLAEQAP